MSTADFAAPILPGYRLVPAPYGGSHDQVTAVFLLTPASAAPALPPQTGTLLRPGQFASPFRLRILHLNDLHGQLARPGTGDQTAVFARVVHRVRQLRAAAAADPHSGVLFLSAGDDLGGSLFDAQGEPGSGGAHPVYRAYSAAGLDAAAPGNHDLDAGPAALAAALGPEVPFPLLAANLQAPPALQARLYPAAIFVVKGLRVGVIGATTPAQKNGHGLQVSDPRPRVRALAAALRRYCDVLLLLSHLGLRLGAESASVQTAGDVEVACSLPAGALQAIIGGHTHDALNEDGLGSGQVVNGIPILQAGALGHFLGEATIRINGRAALSHARLSRTADLPPDAPFQAQVVAPLLGEVAQALREPLGIVAAHPDFTAEALHNDFASGESAYANFIADALLARLRERGLAVDLALIDATAVHDGLQPGRPLALADWYRVMPYADTVRLLRLSGRELWRLLQDNALRLDLPHEPHVERGFLHFSAGLCYTVLAGEERATLRVGDALLGGASLHAQLARGFTVALSSFVRGKARVWEQGPGAALPLLPGALPLARGQDTGLFLRAEVLAAIRQQGGVWGARDGRLRVLAPPAISPAPGRISAPLVYA